MKKGYALATTLVAMLFVMAISSIILFITQMTNSTKKNNINDFNQYVIMRQITSDFNNLSTDDFIENYQQKGFEKTQVNNEIILNNIEKDYYIKINAEKNIEIIKKNT